MTSELIFSHTTKIFDYEVIRTILKSLFWQIWHGSQGEYRLSNSMQRLMHGISYQMGKAEARNSSTFHRQLEGIIYNPWKDCERKVNVSWESQEFSPAMCAWSEFIVLWLRDNGVFYVHLKWTSCWHLLDSIKWYLWAKVFLIMVFITASKGKLGHR